MKVHCVTPNPAVDVTYEIPPLMIHETNRVASVAHRPGGKGVNVARILEDQTDFPVAVYGFLGGDTGEEVSKTLRELSPSITQSWTRVSRPTRMTIAVVDPAGTTMLNEHGCGVDPSDWGKMTVQLLEATSPGDWVVVSGSMPHDTAEGELGSFVTRLQDVGVNTAVDTSGKWLLEAARAKAKLVKPNLSELVEATGIADTNKAIAYLHDLGVEIVVVSMGAEGALLSTPDVFIHGRLNRELEGNPTGAGDAMVAGMIFELASNETVMARDVLATGICWSAAAVLSEVAGEIKTSDRVALSKILDLEEKNVS